MDQLQGGPSRILSLPASHPTEYEKFVMDKYIKAENTQKLFINGFSSFQISYFMKRLTLNKEELILDKGEEILSLRLRDLLS